MAVMPQAEFDVAPPLVTALLAAQLPDLAYLPGRAVGGGWDNTPFRLGEHLVVRPP